MNCIKHNKLQCVNCIKHDRVKRNPSFTHAGEKTSKFVLYIRCYRMSERMVRISPKLEERYKEATKSGKNTLKRVEIDVGFNKNKNE